MKNTILCVTMIAIGLAGCASGADSIQANYISPITYQNYSCKQLTEEARRVSSRVSAATGAQNSKAAGDAVATGVALVVFWPAAFLIRGDGASAAELARLKGEMEAIELVSTQKKCGIEFARPKDTMRGETEPRS